MDKTTIATLAIGGAGTIAACVAAYFAAKSPTKEDLKRVEDHLAEVDGHLNEQNRRELLISQAERVSITVTTKQGPTNEPLTLFLKIEDPDVTMLRIELINSLGMLSGGADCFPFGDPPDPSCFAATVTQQTAQGWFNSGSTYNVSASQKIMAIRAFLRIGDRESSRSFSVYVIQNTQHGPGAWQQTISVFGSC